MSGVEARFRDYVKGKGVINEKQTKRQLHINDEQWAHCVSLFLERGTITELMVVLGQMTYGFVKPRGRSERVKATPVEREVVGVGAEAPKRGTSEGVTSKASRPRGPSDKPSGRRAQMSAGRVQ